MKCPNFKKKLEIRVNMELIDEFVDSEWKKNDYNNSPPESYEVKGMIVDFLNIIGIEEKIRDESGVNHLYEDQALTEKPRVSREKFDATIRSIIAEIWYESKFTAGEVSPERLERIIINKLGIEVEE